MNPNPVAIETQRVKQALAVPSEAVDRDSSGRSVVRVLSVSDWVVRTVTVGVSDGNWTQVLSGVKEGETVQVTPGS